MNNRFFSYFPDADPMEMQYLTQLSNGWTDAQFNNFLGAYASTRKKPETILLTCLVGVLGVSGIHRFLLDQVGMGILYLLTGGFCLIGTIIDAVNHKKLTSTYNMNLARKIALQLNLTNNAPSIMPPPQATV
jgi:TM2 domain-containing membrane protein YozV